MKHFWKEYSCQILCSLKCKYYVAYSQQQKKCYNVVLTVSAAFLGWGTHPGMYQPSKQLEQYVFCLFFLIHPSLSYAPNLWENVSSNRGLNTHTRNSQLSGKSLSKKPLVNVAALFFMLSCLTKITVSSLGFVACDLILSEGAEYF